MKCARGLFFGDAGSTILTFLLLAGAAFLAAQSATPSFAQTAAGKKEKTKREEPAPSGLEEKVDVTATPIVEGVTLEKDGSPVTRISRHQIENLGARDLSTVVERVPGVVITRYNLVGAYGGGDGGTVFVRGHGTGRPGAEIATLVDGIPRFVGVWTHPLMDTLSLDGLAEVKVHKSAQPVSLGPLAGFASIDMVPTRRDAEGLAWRAYASAGEHATREGVASVAGREGALDYAASASVRRSDGHRENAGGRTSAGFATVGWRGASGWNASAQVHTTDAWADDPGPVTAPSTTFVPRFNTRGTFSVLKVGRNVASWDLEAKGYYDNGAIDWNEFAEQVTVTRWDNRGLRLSARTEPWTGGTLTLGADYDDYGGETYNRIDGIDRPAVDVEFRNVAGWAQLAHRFSGRVPITPSAGVRYNDSKDFGAEWGAELGLTAEVSERTSLYANWARAFNLPGVWAVVLFGRFGAGDRWRELEPEMYGHLEVGAIHRFSEEAELTVAIFRDEVEDAIRFVAPPPPPPIFANIGSYDTEGAEVAFEWSPTARLALYAAGAWLDTEPAELAFAPEWTWSLGVSARPLRIVDVEVQVQHVGDRFYVGSVRFDGPPVALDAYTVATARVGWRPFGGKARGLKVFAQVENVADETYEYRPGYEMPGSTVIAGLEWRDE